MGVVAALRFLNQFRAGNYTSGGQWLDELSLNQIAAEIMGRRRMNLYAITVPFTSNGLTIPESNSAR